jgi:hypothetical protein
MLNALLFLSVMVAAHPQAPVKAQKSALAVAMTCLKLDEATSKSGKLCSYNCAGQRKDVAIAADETCAETIDR